MASCFITGNILDNKPDRLAKWREILIVLACMLGSGLIIVDAHIGAIEVGNALMLMGGLWSCFAVLIDGRFSNPCHLRLLKMPIGNLAQEFLHQRPPSLSPLCSVLSLGAAIMLLSGTVALIVRSWS